MKKRTAANLQNIIQMGTQKGMIRVTGKVGDNIYSDGKYGAKVRSAKELSAKQKKQKADLPQNKRMAVLSPLASAVRNATAYYAGSLKPGSFYSSLHSAFREEPTDHRILLLKKIQFKEVITRYQFIVACPVPVVEVKATKTKYIVDVDINHPAYGKKDEPSFYLQFILIVWNAADNICRHMEESTEWMDVEDTAPKYVTLEYKRTAKDTEYLLACRVVTGMNDGSDERYTSTGMRFLDAGTFTKEGQAILAAQQAAAEAAMKATKPKKQVAVKKRVGVRLKR